MADSFAKVMSLAIFIVLGYVLRRFNILKEEAFAAISALVMNVTSHRRPSPCAYASSAWASNLGDGDIRQRDKCDIHEASNDGHDGANSDRPNDRLRSVRECSHE